LIKTIKMVTKVKYYTLIFFAIVLFLTSCTRPKQNNTKERFVVTSNSLNIRIDPTQLSKPIGTLSKGDTITALASDNYWIMVKVGDQAGFVSNQYLKRIGPIMIPAFITLVERNASIEKWQFWVIAIILILLWVGSELLLLNYEKNLKKNQSISSKNISFSPLVVFVSSILISLLYLYWKDEVIDNLFNNFYIIPKGNDSIAWFIWILVTIISIAILIDLIGSIYKSGVKQGSIIFLSEQLINIVILSTTFFLTITLFLGAIVFLILFFAILYTIIVTENSKSISGFLTGK